MTVREFLTEYLSVIMPADKAKKAAESLAEKYGSLHLIASTSVDVIAESVGISTDTALMIKLLGYVHSRSITDGLVFGKAYSEEEIKDYLVALYTGLHVEVVYCISMDSHGRILSSDRLNIGTVNASEITARSVVECACKRRASSVILAHNHPRGTAAASNQDISSTGIIRNVLAAAGVELVAHYLVSETECKSVGEQIRGI